MSYEIREATVDDLEVVCVHRRAMFHDMGHTDSALLSSMISAFRPWVKTRLGSAEYRAWFATGAEGSVVAGAGLWLMDWPPHLVAPGKPRGNIVNVYTDPAHRRRGLARRLMGTVVDWCRANDVRTVILHSSDAGTALYESLGFRSTNEMRLDLRQNGEKTTS